MHEAVKKSYSLMSSSPQTRLDTGQQNPMLLEVLNPVSINNTYETGSYNWGSRRVVRVAQKDTRVRAGLWKLVWLREASSDTKKL